MIFQLKLINKNKINAQRFEIQGQLHMGIHLILRIELNCQYLCRNQKVAQNINPNDHFLVYIIKSNMRKADNLLFAALLILFLGSQAYAQLTAPLCSQKLYDALKTPVGRMSGVDMQKDLFNTMKVASFGQAVTVLERMALYSSARNQFLRMINQSFVLEQNYVDLDRQQKLSFDYEQQCQNICEPEGQLILKATLPSPKAGSLTTTTDSTCYVPDSLLCADFVLAASQNIYLSSSYEAITFVMDPSRNLLFYVKDQLDRLSYCATYSIEQKRITHICEKYIQWKISQPDPQQDYFSDNYMDQLKTAAPDQQTKINYILSKMKFGEQLGRIFNDCLRYGPLTI